VLCCCMVLVSDVFTSANGGLFNAEWLHPLVRSALLGFSLLSPCASSSAPGAYSRANLHGTMNQFE